MKKSRVMGADLFIHKRKFRLSSHVRIDRNTQVAWNRDAMFLCVKRKNTFETKVLLALFYKIGNENLRGFSVNLKNSRDLPFGFFAYRGRKTNVSD